jgi:hypothetical protein
MVTGSVAGLSLCPSCVFVKETTGRRGQTYLLCRNQAIEAKYPPQPVLACPGYRPRAERADPAP